MNFFDNFFYTRHKENSASNYVIICHNDKIIEFIIYKFSKLKLKTIKS